ncbi:MAG: SRPBCC domain-containing protein [Gelidibacter sp.]
MKHFTTALALLLMIVTVQAQQHPENRSKTDKNKHMKTASYSTTISVAQSPEEVYNAINNVRGWWSEEIEGPTDALNKEWFYHYKDIHLCKIKVVEMVPHKRVVWEVMENSFNFIEDDSEWVGNHLIFEISKEADGTKLSFTQDGLTPMDACYNVCRDGWDNYITNSLRKLITTGKGEPNPKEGEGFNAELASRWKID